MGFWKRSFANSVHYSAVLRVPLGALSAGAQVNLIIRFTVQETALLFTITIFLRTYCVHVLESLFCLFRVQSLDLQTIKTFLISRDIF